MSSNLMFYGLMGFIFVMAVLMTLSSFLPQQKRPGLLLVQIFGLGLFAFFAFSTVSQIRDDAEKVATYLPVQLEITRHEIIKDWKEGRRGDMDPVYTGISHYRYSVAGREYTSREEITETGDPDYLAQRLAEYPVGSVHTGAYNPRSPSGSYLVPPPPPSRMFAGLIPFALLLLFPIYAPLLKRGWLFLRRRKPALPPQRERAG